MDGENKMLGIAIELLTNLVQSFIFTGFLYMYFEKPSSKLKKLLPFLGAWTMMFSVCSFFTLSNIHTGVDVFYIDSLLCISSLMAYSILFLKGNIYTRIIMPIFTFVINALVSYGFSYIVSFFMSISPAEFFTVSTYSRYTALVVVNATTALIFWFILRLSPRKILLSGIFETAVFAIIAILSIIILYCCMFVYQKSDFSDEILIYLLICCASVLVIVVLMYLLLVRISRINESKTRFLLMSQRDSLYEKSILAANEQIKNISNIKHDTRNRLSTLEKLIEEGSYEKAMELCKNTNSELNSAYTPANTKNPVLNAILNVELEKAYSSGIELITEISDDLRQIDSFDTVSVIGNICDNAIEYLKNSKIKDKTVSLKIRTHLDFCIITCQNPVSSPVLIENPDLNTTKADKRNHGQGISILKKIAEKYSGDFLTSDKDGCFTSSLILRKKSEHEK